MPTRVAILSPYSGDIIRNTRYALACCRDCIERGESPFAGHLFYTRFLVDDNPIERDLGMRAFRDWMLAADIVAIYTDLGASKGMREDQDFAIYHRLRLASRRLPRDLFERTFTP